MTKPAQEPQDQIKEPAGAGGKPDGEQPGGAAATPKPSDTPGGELSGEQKTSYTRPEVDELLRASQGEKDRKVTLLEKQVANLQRVETDYKALSEKAKQVDAAKRQAELEAAEGDPDAKDRVTKLHQMQDTIQELEGRQKEVEGWLAEHEAELERANEIGKKEIAGELATEFGVSAEAILEFDADTPDAMRKVAEKLAKVVKPQGVAGKSMPDNPAHGTPPSRDLSGKSPMELSRMAYSPEETARRKST